MVIFLAAGDYPPEKVWITNHPGLFTVILVTAMVCVTAIVIAWMRRD